MFLEKKNTELEKSNQEYKEKIQQLEVKQEELEIRVEELEERVEIEVEMNLKALDKSREWHDRREYEKRLYYYRTKNREWPIEKETSTRCLWGKNKIKQIKRLTKKVKQKLVKEFKSPKRKLIRLKMSSKSLTLISYKIPCN